MAQQFNADKYTPLKAQENLFSDLYTDFTVHPDLHDLTIKKNEEAVKTAIRNLILTNRYERPFNPTYGGNIRKYLFEPITPATQDAIRSEIVTAIENYEPRARIISVIVTPYVDQNAYAVTITFYVINTSTQVTLNTILYRVR